MTNAHIGTNAGRRNSRRRQILFLVIVAWVFVRMRSEQKTTTIIQKQLIKLQQDQKLSQNGYENIPLVATLVPATPVASISNDVRVAAGRTRRAFNGTKVQSAPTGSRKRPWEEYRLGDWVFRKGQMYRGFSRDFKETLAWEYVVALNQTDGNVIKRPDGALVSPGMVPKLDLFCDLVKAHGKHKSPDALPRGGDLVIHLRLGDVLDQFMQFDEVEDVFQYGVSIVPSQIRNMRNQRNTQGWWHYVKSKCYYENMLTQLAHKTSSKTAAPERVVIVGSALHHTKKGFTTENSIRYSRLVENFFIAKGYEVATRFDALPDEDMVWISHSPIFVPAGGGFSRLASKCVECFGGLAFPYTGGWNKGLDQPCGNAPYPPIPTKAYSWETNMKWSGTTPWNGIKNYPPEQTIW